MRSIRTLLPLVKQQRGQVLVILVLHGLSAVLSLFTFLSVVPFLRVLFGGVKPSSAPLEGSEGLAAINQWFDAIVQVQGSAWALGMLCLAMVVLAVLKNAVQYAALYAMAGIRTGVSRDLRQSLYGRLLSMPMAWFTESKKGDVMSRFTHDLMEVEHSVIGSIEAMLKSPLMILVSLVTLLVLSWKLTLFAFILLPVTGVLISRWSKRLKRHAQRGKEELGQLVSVLEESLAGMRIVKAFNAEPFFKEAYQFRNEEHFKAMRRMHRRESMSSPMSEVVSLSVMSMLLAYGGTLVLAGDSALSGDWFIGYLVVFSQIIPPARSLSDGYFRVSKGVASLERLESLFGEVEVDEAGLLQELPASWSQISFRGVEYSYPSQSSPALSGFDLTLKRGEVVALVGTSGAGKTTVAHLLSKFAKPDQGHVCIDDQDLGEVSGAAWRDRLAVVTQDALLFHGTIASNIALADVPVDRDRLLWAARAAHVMEFAEDLPHGLDSEVGDGGGKLSGGQRQRVALARALYRNAEVLILDEATSALDAASESMVQDALGRIMEDVTVLVIAHRMSTIRDADRIVVMDQGRVAEEGTHAALLSLKGKYAELHHLQQG